jgi:hypothetical protein
LDYTHQIDNINAVIKNNLLTEALTFTGTDRCEDFMVLSNGNRIAKLFCILNADYVRPLVRDIVRAIPSPSMISYLLQRAIENDNRVFVEEIVNNRIIDADMSEVVYNWAATNSWGKHTLCPAVLPNIKPDNLRRLFSEACSRYNSGEEHLIQHIINTANFPKEVLVDELRRAYIKGKTSVFDKIKDIKTLNEEDVTIPEETKQEQKAFHEFMDLMSPSKNGYSNRETAEKTNILLAKAAMIMDSGGICTPDVITALADGHYRLNIGSLNDFFFSQKVSLDIFESFFSRGQYIWQDRARMLSEYVKTVENPNVIHVYDKIKSLFKKMINNVNIKIMSILPDILFFNHFSSNTSIACKKLHQEAPLMTDLFNALVKATADTKHTKHTKHTKDADAFAMSMLYMYEKKGLLLDLNGLNADSLAFASSFIKNNPGAFPLNDETFPTKLFNVMVGRFYFDDHPIIQWMLEEYMQDHLSLPHLNKIIDSNKIIDKYLGNHKKIEVLLGKDKFVLLQKKVWSRTEKDNLNEEESKDAGQPTTNNQTPIDSGIKDTIMKDGSQ